MLTKLSIRNLKKLEKVEIDLGKAVVFVGPNNSGKTTALQALALWQFGLSEWNIRRGSESSAEKRPGVSLNRRELISLPVPAANQLWRRLETRHVRRNGGKPETENVRIEIVVEGVDDASGNSWVCGLEFDYANEESIYCRPLRVEGIAPMQRMPVPPESRNVKVSYLPPMSGLAAVEPKLERGRVDVLLGEGQTAQVLRNMCHQIAQDASDDLSWHRLTTHIKTLFGITIDTPKYIAARGEITMTYRDMDGTVLDISSAGRGLQQTLLLLAHIYANPRSILLLDEPDAHLETLKQREIYNLVVKVADEKGAQLICASHSEIVLNEAADKDVVIAFVGAPHRIDGRSAQVRKALNEIGYDQYYEAERTGWCLYLEGSTDLAILLAFAETLEHPARFALSAPFVRYVGNEPAQARSSFYGLREAVPHLIGVAVFDRLPIPPDSNNDLSIVTWRKNEIENYVCFKETLQSYAASGPAQDLIDRAEQSAKVEAMHEAISIIESALRDLGRDAWSSDIKASTEVLEPVFRKYFELLKQPMLVRKTNLHELARFVPAISIDPQIKDVLDLVASAADRAQRRRGVEA